MIYRHCFSTVL